ncbi:MAG: hypothetical protein J0I23_26875 [Rhizobiales bacterium]|nr:hypothetical protein [Hyphomicrobiales bacterium]
MRIELEKRPGGSRLFSFVSPLLALLRAQAGRGKACPCEKEPDADGVERHIIERRRRPFQPSRILPF